MFIVQCIRSLQRPSKSRGNACSKEKRVTANINNGVRCMMYVQRCWFYKKENPGMTTITATARKKGDLQLYVGGETLCHAIWVLITLFVVRIVWRITGTYSKLARGGVDISKTVAFFPRGFMERRSSNERHRHPCAIFRRPTALS